MSIKKVVVAGGGVLGTQIAYQAAYCGFDVTIWLRSQGSIGRTKPKIENVHEAYIKAINLMNTAEGKTAQNFCRGLADFDTFNAEECLKKNENAHNSIKIELNLETAVKDADLVIESMAEDVKAKTEFYKMLAPVLPKKTILVTNSSTLLPSKFAKVTGCPERYLSLHFANEIWKNNTAEIMAQSKTEKKYYDDVVTFAADIRMIPLQLHKEKNGYILNSMLVPFLFSAMDLWATDVSDPKTIDTTWVMGTGAPKGPFQIIDVVGLTTCLNIVNMYVKIPSFLAPYHFKDIAKRLQKMIDEGKKGFYTK
ncbi:MAG: 3-hydroxyacyl-CoA dehydrogenase [Bacilli bacterium]